MLTFKRITRLIKGYKRYFALSVICAFLGVTFYMIRPIILQVIVDSVIGNKPIAENGIIGRFVNAAGGVGMLKDNLWICGIAIIITIGLYCLFIFIRDRFATFAAESFAKDTKDKLYDHIQRMPYDYHVNVKSGDLIQRCTSDVETVRRFFSSQLPTIARIISTVIIALVVMFSNNAKLTFVAAASTPILFAYSFIFYSKIKRNFRKSDEMEGELSTVLQESLTGVRVVRAFGRQKYELDKFMDKNKALAKLNGRLVFLLALYWSISDFLIYIQIGVVLIYCTYLAAKGEISLGTMLLFLSYEGTLLWPIRQLGRVLSDMGKMQISLERLFDILNSRTEEHNPDDVKPSLKGDIEFKNVTFEYTKGRPVLDNVSFTIKNGETVSVLGTTGSGKSTIMLLLLRLYEYKQGSITINGVELNTIDKEWLRENIGIVLQEPFLYSNSIRNNIRMADFDASDAEIEESANTACAHGFITEFEKGYETMLGERGVTLSGGQRQRVAIARMLVRNSDVLIFDDSLSAVDTDTDAKIRAALAEKQKDITTFIISQRITTLMSADKILVFENGKLTNTGTHKELISREGLYSRIWNIQNMLEEDFDKEAI